MKIFKSICLTIAVVLLTACSYTKTITLDNENLPKAIVNVPYQFNFTSPLEFEFKNYMVFMRITPDDLGLYFPPSYIYDPSHNYESWELKRMNVTDNSIYVKGTPKRSEYVYIDLEMTTYPTMYGGVTVYKKRYIIEVVEPSK